MLFEPEAAAGGRAATVPLLLQPRLTIGGWTAPLSLLEVGQHVLAYRVCSIRLCLMLHGTVPSVGLAVVAHHR